MADEFALIRRHFASLAPPRRHWPLGIGDDAALLEPPAGMALAICADTLVADVHFRADDPPADVGWKALAVNLSDLAAMGAEPLGWLLCISLPQADGRWLEQFCAGAGELAASADCPLVGGDTTRGPLSVTVTAVGAVPPGMALRRDGARSGMAVCVSGTLGDAAWALRSDDPPPELLARLRRPRPRLALGLALRGIAAACIDISDGLAADLGHVLAASGCGAVIDADRIPASPALSGLPAQQRRELQLAGGDDYELCVVLDEARLPALEAAGHTLHPIGRTVPEPGLVVHDGQGATITPATTGYRHFDEH